MVFNCTIEYLQNLQQLLVYIPIDVSINNFETKLFINRSLKTLLIDDDGCSELLISVRGKLGLSRLALPIHGTINIIPQVNIIDNVLLLQFRNFAAMDIDGVDLTHPLTSKDLNSGFSGFACSNCHHQLKEFKDDAAPILFHDLPNEHWLELLDCWSCHDNEFAPIAERALGQSKVKSESECSGHKSCSSNNLFPAKSYNETNNSDDALILPKPGKIFIGLRHIFTNSVNFNLIQCPECCANLGSIIKDNNLKINREAIIYRFNDAKTQKDLFITILMHQILDVIDNHSTFHFILTSSSDRKLYIKPIGWKTRVFDEASDSWKFSFKVGFTENLNTFQADAETITCSDKQFDEIKLMLQNNHKIMLFGSSIKMPGSDELYLSYLINL